MFLIMEAVQVTLRLMTNYQEGVRMQLLSRLAYRDGLTDLLNRTSYMEELKNWTHPIISCVAGTVRCE